MASKRQIKKVVKAAQKKPKLFITLLIIFILLGAAFVTVDYLDIYDFGYFGPTKEAPITDEFMITFLETGNRNTGDSIYVKAGDTDLLIDAGSTKSSASTIINHLDKYIKDDKLEYVIATHAHEDHIAGFVGLSTGQGIFERYNVETIIDFPKTNSSSKIYSEYCAERDAEIASGAVHYTALECYKEENGAKRIINLSEDVTLEFLYNYYYENNTTNENNYSVCVLIKHGSRSFLLTGDLEDKGEEYLVEYNKLPKVDVYKAGHHGSYTAGSEELLSVIQPDIVCICCCAGTDEYTKDPLNMFPAQDFISRISKYTERVYVTTLGTDDGFTSMNGDITVVSNTDGLVLYFSNNDTILKDTEWFKENRKWE
jgi:competence protein ComEC